MQQALRTKKGIKQQHEIALILGLHKMIKQECTTPVATTYISL